MSRFDASRHIASRLRRTVTGPMWHGPSAGEALDGVTAAMAHQRMASGAHSIWALVLHMTVWAEIALARLDGERLAYPPDDVDWPAVPAEASEAAWSDAVAALGTAYARLADRVAQLDGDALLARVPENDYSVAVMLDGVVEHGVYHAGQIKKGANELRALTADER